LRLALGFGSYLKLDHLSLEGTAMGMPAGSDLEYVDDVTMDKALANRHEM
jgi:recombinational DNA repair protein RecR